MEIKRHLLNSCEAYIDKRVDQLEKAIEDLKEALKLETKCSMGDKYETSRAMLHLEFEKLSLQYKEYQKLRRTLSMIDPSIMLEMAKFGAIVQTTGHNYFLSVPVGELSYEGENYYAIGTASPIARALLEKQPGDRVNFKGKEILITAVF